MKKTEIIKILKFALVGFAGVIIDIALTWFLKEKLEVNLYLSHVLGFCTAATNNFCLNKYWTFGGPQKMVILQFIAFFSTALFGLFISTACIWILYNFLNYDFYFSKILAIGLAAIWNYVINRLWVFRGNEVNSFSS